MGSMIRVVLVAALASTAYSQSTPPPPAAAPSSSPTTAPPASTGTFSIEADIFAYKSLQSDSEAIACDIAGYFANPSSSAGLPRGPEFVFESGTTACERVSAPKVWNNGVVLVSSTGSTVTNYQIWRTTMLVMSQLIAQGKNLDNPNVQTPAQLPPDLSSSFSLAGQAITLVQGVLALFASNQSATGIAGTVPDQALTNDVSRQLRNLGVQVLMPDTYASYSLSGINPATSPFISSLSALIKEHARLQGVLQTNLVIVNAAQKLQADFIARSADNTKLASAAPADRPAIQNDLANLNAEIQQIQQQLLNVNVGAAQRTAIQAQSLIAAMESFLANLTGGNVAFAGQSTSPSPPPSTGAPPSTPPAAAQQPAAAATPTPSAPTATSSTPPILAVIAADGLARAMGVTPGSPTLEPTLNWRLLWLKTLESGGSLITQSNIFGSKVHFSGGAIATYDLFTFDGNLSCSGVAFAYGGYVKAKDFVGQLNRHDIDPRTQLVYVRGGCKPD
jgi:hypothetical protein